MAKWLRATSYGTPITLLTTEMNSLANNTLTAAGTAIANETNEDLLADFVLHEAMAVSTNIGALELWLAFSIDGGSTYTEPAFAGTFGSPPSGTSAHERGLQGITIPPGHALPYIYNDGTGQAMASSGNTLKMGTYQTQNS